MTKEITSMETRLTALRKTASQTPTAANQSAVTLQQNQVNGKKMEKMPVD
jgi:hypothetical protein